MLLRLLCFSVWCGVCCSNAGLADCWPLLWIRTRLEQVGGKERNRQPDGIANMSTINGRFMLNFRVALVCAFQPISTAGREL